MKKWTFVALLIAALLPRAAEAQAVIVPTPIPVCANNDALIWDSSLVNFKCLAPALLGQPLVDSTGIVRNAADATKILKFNVAAITTGTTRTWTIPDADITIPSAIAGLTSNTFTGAQTITAGTVTANTPFLNATQTWNNGAVTFTGLKANITDTASASASLLIDLQVGGTSKFKVDKSGKLTASSYADIVLATGNNITSAGGAVPIAGGLQVTAGNSTFTGTIALNSRFELTAGSTTGLLLLRNSAETKGVTLDLESADGTLWIKSRSETDAATIKVNKITTTGMVYVNETANAKMTLGLTINQGTATNEIVALKNNGVAHGITTDWETNTFSALTPASAAGGLQLDGIRGTGLGGGAVRVRGVNVDAANTAKSTAARGVVEVLAGVKSGTTIGNVGVDGNLMIISNNGDTEFIFDAEGSAHANIEWTTFDSHQDLDLLRSLEYHVTPQKNPYRARWDLPKYSREDLEAAKLVSFDREHPERERVFINLTRMPMLLSGAIRQESDARTAEDVAQLSMIQALQRQLVDVTARMSVIEALLRVQ